MAGRGYRLSPPTVPACPQGASEGSTCCGCCHYTNTPHAGTVGNRTYTCDTYVLQDRDHVSRVERLSDAVVHLESFAGSDKEQNPLYREYHGTLQLFETLVVYVHTKCVTVCIQCSLCSARSFSKLVS